MNLLAQRIADKHFLKLIERFLKAGIMEGHLFKRTELGTPQGAICSPILANIYLHQLDCRPTSNAFEVASGSAFGTSTGGTNMATYTANRKNVVEQTTWEIAR